MAFVEVFVLGFSVLIALSVVWSTLKTGISPTMSSAKSRKVMLDLITDYSSGPIIDLGSGWGTLVIAAAQKYPSRKVIGYELSWFPWLVSIMLKCCLRLDNLVIHRKDFNYENINDASVLCCYLFPGAMVELANKLQREVDKKVLLISNTFALPSYDANKVVRLKDMYRTPIYVYHCRPVSYKK